MAEQQESSSFPHSPSLYLILHQSHCGFAMLSKSCFSFTSTKENSFIFVLQNAIPFKPSDSPHFPSEVRLQKRKLQEENENYYRKCQVTWKQACSIKCYQDKDRLGQDLQQWWVIHRSWRGVRIEMLLLLRFWKSGGSYSDVFPGGNAQLIWSHQPLAELLGR